MDKSLKNRKVKPKGKDYCEKKGTSCYYNSQNLCVNCGRPKGWRRYKQSLATQK